jgi:hypothetical protein
MIEFKVKWTLCPTAYNPTQVLFVEAADAAAAEAIARDHIERKHGVGGWVKFETVPAEAPPAGRVLGI